MLEVTGLVAGYGGHGIARVDRLVVEPGGAAVLAGSSGAGKTTALLAIAGLAERIDGEIVIAGEAMSRLGARARDRHRGAHIGMIFQDLHLVPGLSAVDNLLLAPYACGAAQRRGEAVTLLDRLGLGDRVNADASTLSRGEAQRAALARALLLQPKLILADEPTASLDDESCAAVLDLLTAATREAGAALVVATHDVRVKAVIPHVVEARRA